MGKRNDILVSSAESILNQPASSPCMASEFTDSYRWPPQVNREGRARSLRNSLARVLGWGMPERLSSSRQELLERMAALFEHKTYGSEVTLEKHNRAWQRIYLVEFGVARLYRQSPDKRVSIHHFFDEGCAIWPVFARTRSERNTLCLTNYGQGLSGTGSAHSRLSACRMARRRDCDLLAPQEWAQPQALSDLSDVYYENPRNCGDFFVWNTGRDSQRPVAECSAALC